MAAKVGDARAELICGKIEDLPWGDRRFARICSMNVIQFLPDRQAALATLKAALKPGGRLGFVRVHVETLELQPAPAVCVLDDLPPARGPKSSRPA